jgi:hypothetical protein
MKNIFAGMAVVLLFAGCGSSNVGGVAQNQCSGAGDCPPAQEPMMALKTTAGNQSVPFSYVQSIDVQIYKTDGVGIDIERTFSGTSAGNVAAQLGLVVPQSENTDQLMPSGVIFMKYLDPNTSVQKQKLFNIFQENVLNDSDFPNVTYTPLKTLDHDWLASQTH